MIRSFLNRSDPAAGRDKPEPAASSMLSEGLSGFLEEVAGSLVVMHERHGTTAGASAPGAVAAARDASVSATGAMAGADVEPSGRGASPGAAAVAEPLRPEMVRRRSDGSLVVAAAPQAMTLPVSRRAAPAPDLVRPGAAPERSAALAGAVAAKPACAAATPAAPALRDVQAQRCARGGCSIAADGLACLHDLAACTNPRARLSLAGYELRRIRVREREAFVFAVIDVDDVSCPRCGGLAMVVEEFVDTALRDRPIGDRRILFFVDRRVCRCQHCAAVVVEPMPSTFTPEMTDRLIDWIAVKSRDRPLGEIARQAGIDDGGTLVHLVDARRQALQNGASGTTTTPWHSSSEIAADAGSTTDGSGRRTRSARPAKADAPAA